MPGRWLLALWLGGLAPSGADTTAVLPVSATVTPGCLVVGGGSAYGTLDFGTQSALATQAVTTALGTSSVTLQCTPGVAVGYSVGAGQNGGSGNLRNLRRTGGSDVLAYQLYADAALSQPVTVNTSGVLSYTDATAIRLGLYGRALLTGRVPAGLYTDVVQVTLTW